MIGSSSNFQDNRRRFLVARIPVSRDLPPDGGDEELEEAYVIELRRELGRFAGNLVGFFSSIFYLVRIEVEDRISLKNREFHWPLANAVTTRYKLHLRSFQINHFHVPCLSLARLQLNFFVVRHARNKNLCKNPWGDPYRKCYKVEEMKKEQAARNIQLFASIFSLC